MCVSASRRRRAAGRNVINMRAITREPSLYAIALIEESSMREYRAAMNLEKRENSAASPYRNHQEINFSSAASSPQFVA